MKYRKEILSVISINEASDLSKHVSNLYAMRFINGILDRLKDQIGATRGVSEYTGAISSLILPTRYELLTTRYFRPHVRSVQKIQRRLRQNCRRHR